MHAKKKISTLTFGGKKQIYSLVSLAQNSRKIYSYVQWNFLFLPQMEDIFQCVPIILDSS